MLVVRLDVHYPDGYTPKDKNKDISSLFAKLSQKYTRMGYDPAYAWAREIKNSELPHYHCFLLLNGNLARSPYPVFEAAENLWGSTIDASAKGLIHHCNKDYQGNPQKNGIMIRRNAPNFEDKIREVGNQLSYLAKTDGKGKEKDGFRNFGTSSSSTKEKVKKHA